MMRVEFLKALIHKIKEYEERKYYDQPHNKKTTITFQGIEFGASDIRLNWKCRQSKIESIYYVSLPDEEFKEMYSKYEKFLYLATHWSAKQVLKGLKTRLDDEKCYDRSKHLAEMIKNENTQDFRDTIEDWYFEYFYEEVFNGKEISNVH